VLLDAFRESGGPRVVESGAIDERAILRQAKQPRAWISRLRVISDRAGFDETETK
jgi:hypothetical protein